MSIALHIICIILVLGLVIWCLVSSWYQSQTYDIVLSLHGTGSAFIVTDSLGVILNDYHAHSFCDEVSHSADAESLAQLCWAAS